MKVLKTLKRLGKRVSGSWATQLPVNGAQFDLFCDDLFLTYGLPDLPSYRHTVATMIMHLDATKNKAPKKYFAKSILKAMSNEIAYGKILFFREQEKQEEAKTQNETLWTASVEPIQHHRV